MLIGAELLLLVAHEFGKRQKRLSEILKSLRVASNVT